MSPRSWDINPAITAWLLVPGAVLGGVLVIYLYRAQGKIASRGFVAALTVIRTLLVLLVFALLLGPVMVWTRARHSSGTLWVLVDTSQSMRQVDPQATQQERLHWADALGYLPAELRPDHLNVQVERLTSLRDDLEHLKSQAALLPSDEKGHQRLVDLTQALKDWNAKLNEVADALANDRAMPSGLADIWTELRKSAGLASQAAAQLDAPKLEDAAAAIPFQALHDALSSQITKLQPIAEEADSKFLAEHGSDARVRDALAKVKPLTRADLAYAALTGQSTHGLKGLAQMLGREDVKIVPFGDRAALNSPEKQELEPTLRNVLRDPSGQNTDISQALRFVSDQLGEDSTVVIVSDGRQNVGSEPEEPAQYLGSRGARVFTLMIGSRQTARDAAVDHVDAPDWVYAEDDVVVSPVIRLDGLKDREATVEFRRAGELIDSKKVKAKTDQEKLRLRFTDKPPREGLYDYDVVIKPVADEAVADNNRQSVRVVVKKDKLNVLLVEDEPRWEYQFLRNYLIRDHRIKLQAVLAEPARIENIQPPAGTRASPKREEGQVDAQELPATKAEWSGFDVVILGDVPPEKLPLEQQKNLAGALRDGGIRGLLLIAGMRNMPMRYAGTPLAELMPVELSGARWTPQELQEHLRRGFVPSNAPEGLSSVLSQFSEDPGMNAELWASVPRWFWHAEQTTARPGASVIWSIEEPSANRSRGVSGSQANTPDEMETLRQHALLSTMNVGLGRVLYLASPETWRFRYVQTSGPDSHVEDLHRRFWGQVLRWAAGNDLPAGGKLVKFGTDKHSYIGGEPIVVTARVLKDDFTPLQGQSFKLIAGKAGAPAGAPAAGEAAMVEAPAEGPGIYRGTLTLPSGSYVLAIRGGEPERLLAADSSVDPNQKTLGIEVQPNATLEDRDVNTDPQRMASIARAGSGMALDGPYFDVLAEHLPVIDHTEIQVTQAGLFSDPHDGRTYRAHWVFFLIFIILITAEWMLRKRGGLV